jgi:hypothetical protein
MAQLLVGDAAHRKLHRLVTGKSTSVSSHNLCSVNDWFERLVVAVWRGEQVDFLEDLPPCSLTILARESCIVAIEEGTSFARKQKLHVEGSLLSQPLQFRE